MKNTGIRLNTGCPCLLFSIAQYSQFILHREIVLTMKTNFTLRAYLMSEDTSIAR